MPPPATEATLPRATPDSTTVATDVGPTSTSVVEVPATILVHVAGAVVVPGVYELPGAARIREALVAAGGPTADADWNALNLAAPIADGTRLYVPVVGETPPVPIVTAPVAGADQLAGPVDINRATASELDALPGVGPATAAAIVTERERNGPFVGVDDLDRVPGIGPAKLAAIRDLVTT
jgi:competence protein ComEA